MTNLEKFLILYSDKYGIQSSVPEPTAVWLRHEQNKVTEMQEFQAASAVHIQIHKIPDSKSQVQHIVICC
jgi:hypothetical protein